MTYEEMIALPVEQQKQLIQQLDSKRKKGKVVNFSAQYLIGIDSLARNSGIPKSEAKLLFDTYWKRNWAIKEVAKNALVKDAIDGKWIYNPISKLWMTLRNDKDRFSALNQSSGVYVFDIFVMYCRHLGLTVPMQMHDELLVYSIDNESEIEKTKNIFKKAIALTNKRLNLNVKIDIDIKYGINYSDVH